MDLVIAAITICAAVALGFVACRGVYSVIQETQSDIGFTQAQLDEIERLCESQLEAMEADNRYASLYDRCEAREKFRVNPDPLG